VCALVGVLETAPSANVINEDGAEVGLTSLDVPDQRLDPVPAIEAKAAFPRVGVGPYDFQALLLGIFTDRTRLVLGRIALMLRRHPDVLSRPLCRIGRRARGSPKRVR
jgi:hypothetical protein